MIKGVIFDMDGTLFDTEYVNDIVMEEVLADYGYEMPEGLLNNLRCTGTQEEQRILKETFGENFEYQEIRNIRVKKMRKYYEDNGIPKKPGVEEILEHFKKKGYPMAVASASTIDNVKHNLQISGLADYFDVVMGGDLVENSKPHPEIFITAAQKLGLKPEETIAIEDSPNGIRSASGAGCLTIMVPDIVPADDELKSLSQVVLPSLHEVIPYVNAL